MPFCRTEEATAARTMQQIVTGPPLKPSHIAWPAFTLVKYQVIIDFV